MGSRNRLTAWLSGLRDRRRLARQRRAIEATRLFDVAWYRARHGLAEAEDALGHLLAGPPQARPSPWFDAEWYLARHPDVGRAGLNPLAHYILFGAAEARDPNPAFANRWWLDNHPEAASHPTPLDHYLAEGAARGDDPNPAFDAAWYARTHMADGEGAGLDPLAHYLLIGRPAGVRPQPLSAILPGEPLEAARLEGFKPLADTEGRVVVLLAVPATDGRLPDGLLQLVDRLAEAGAAVALVIEADAPAAPPPELTARLAGGFVREARGFRYAAWAHLLRGEPWLFAGSALALLGPEALDAPDAAAALVRQAAKPQADIIAAEVPDARPKRLDGRLVVLAGRALTFNTLHNFFADWTCREGDAAAVRRDFETRFTAAVQKGGFSRAPLPFALPPAAAPPEPAPSAPLGPLLPASATPPERPWKLAFIGPWNYATGLSQASRGYVSALWRTGARLNLHPIAAPFHVHKRIAPAVAAYDFAGAADAAIVHLNPDGWGMLTPDQRAVIGQARVRIGLWVWEMGQVPPSWRADFDSVDEIWAPSEYCAQVFRSQTAKPVSVVPHVVPLPPEPDRATRAATLASLGFEPDARLILYVFDGASFLVRKNPEALVRAFAASELAERGWRVALKVKHLMDQPAHGAALARLAEATPGVRLVDAQFSPEALAALFDAADIYASPHRSEGFGLTLAEAMGRGTPVVASACGGVTDFLDQGCGYPVPARTVRLDRDLGPYPKGGEWGEVDEAAFAEALAACAARIEAGDRSLGAAARARIAERLSADAVAQAIVRALGAAFARRADARAAA